MIFDMLSQRIPKSFKVQIAPELLELTQNGMHFGDQIAGLWALGCLN